MECNDSLMVQEQLLEPQPSPWHSRQQKEGMDKEWKISSFYRNFEKLHTTFLISRAAIRVPAMMSVMV